MSDLTVKAHDTYPPLVATLDDTTLSSPGVPIDLTAATSIKLLMKGTSVLVTGACTKLTVASPTASTSTGSNVLSSVSSFTNVQRGSSVIGAGIPNGALVGAFDSTAATITLVDGTGAPVNATATTGGVPLTVNKGTVQYSWATNDLAVVDSYQVEFEITWPSGIQTVPNGGYRSITVMADLEGA